MDEWSVITCIRLRDEFVFLAVILDAYSRRVIGWALDRTMEDELPLAALRMALSRRAVEAGLVHHSDRGSQDASNTATWRKRALPSARSWKGSTTRNACTSALGYLPPAEFEQNQKDAAARRLSV